MHLLLVDSEAEGQELAENLCRNGHEVTQVARGHDAIAHQTLDLVLLGRDLPDLDGHEVCRQIRAVSTVPIIVFGGPCEEIDRVLALNVGADDYLVKPFGLRELLARIHAVGRRSAGGGCQHGSDGGTGTSLPPAGYEPDGKLLELGKLRVDLRQRRADVRGSQLHLTRKEFDLLAVLMEDPGAVYTRETLLVRVWDEKWFGSSRTVDAHVSQLRAKLGDGRWVETVRGVGFRLANPEHR